MSARLPRPSMGHAVLLTPPKSSHLKSLLPRQHFASISPLAATLMDLLASVANKRLTAELNPLDATLTKNRGVGVFFPIWRSLRGHGDENSHFIQVLSFHIVAHSFPVNLRHSPNNPCGIKCFRTLCRHNGGGYARLLPFAPPTAGEGALGSDSPFPHPYPLSRFFPVPLYGRGDP
jgi:hypothetical protein